MDRHYLAIDLGAESGRVMHGILAQGKLALEEIHRFQNQPVQVSGSLRWNAPQLMSEIKTGLRKAALAKLPIASVSCDAWGVDYAWLGESGPLPALPYHYRDARTDGAMEKVFAQVPAEAIFAATGIQFMPINTLFQLWIEARERPEITAAADRFLNIGDYFNYLLCGDRNGEVTAASTTQLLDPRKKAWAWELIEDLGLPRRLFPPLREPGTPLSPLSPDIARETGLAGARVVATCSHDTAAAVAAIPAAGDDWAFLSSGTWSLIGAELKAPIINAEARAANFTNECGYRGSIMFRKNIVGLWIVQECRRAWVEAGHEYDYSALTRLATEAEPFLAFIRPDDPSFAKPGRMPEKIADFCRETGQKVPQGAGAMIRCVLESLALLYAETLDTCARLTGKKFAALHVVGGGSKNGLLNEFTAAAVGLRVLAGPAEATAIGNLLIQAQALGHLSADAHGGDLRQVVRDSFPTETVAPKNPSAWTAARRRFAALNASHPEPALAKPETVKP